MYSLPAIHPLGVLLGLNVYSDGCEGNWKGLKELWRCQPLLEGYGPTSNSQYKWP